VRIAYFRDRLLLGAQRMVAHMAMGAIAMHRRMRMVTPRNQVQTGAQYGNGSENR
jgi:hypothetical protein